MTRKWKSVTAALGVVALLAPAASAERPAQKKSKSKKAGTEKVAKGKDKAKNAVFRGTVVSVDEATGSVVVDVTSASRWGRGAVGGDAETFTVEGARVKVQDTNGNGAGLDDFAAGDRVHVKARVARDQDFAQPMAARKVDNKTAKAPEEAGTELETDAGTEAPPAA